MFVHVLAGASSEISVETEKQGKIKSYALSLYFLHIKTSGFKLSKQAKNNLIKSDPTNQSVSKKYFKLFNMQRQ